MPAVAVTPQADKYWPPLTGLPSFASVDVMVTKSPIMNGTCCLESQARPKTPRIKPFRQDGIFVAPRSGAAPGTTGGRSTVSMTKRVIGRPVVTSIGRLVIGQTGSMAGGATRGMHIG